MTNRHWAVVPAAGSGKRMNAEVPKQYLQLCGQSVLQHTLQRLLDFNLYEAIVVALAQDDDRFNELPVAGDARIDRVVGGAERSDSVLAGLDRLKGRAAEDDWVWVHDAARPCVSESEMRDLQEALSASANGALLARPVVDTVKMADAEGRVSQTLDRSLLWLAQTPQVFRYKALSEALIQAREQGWLITDEASAMERAGGNPLLVPGLSSNIKITRAGDLQLAESYLLQEQNICE